MNNLFSDDENVEGGSNSRLTINEHYAKAFEYRKEREELERLKAKYGFDYDPDASDSEFSTDSESAESEDEDGEELTPVVDAAILRTLARIRKKDPAIYDSGKNIYGEEQERLHSTIPMTNAKPAKSNKREKPLTVRQVNLDAMLNPSRTPPPEVEQHPLTHVEEQEILRRETIAAFHGAVDNQADDDFLIPREKTQDEREREEEEYRAFLEREVGDLREVVSVDGLGNDGESLKEEVVENEDGKDTQVEKKKRKKAKDERATNNELLNGKQKKTKIEKDQEFLMNYILNRGWIDRSTGRVPTYGEITSPGESGRKKKGKAKAKPGDDSEMDVEDPGNSDADEMDTGLLSDTSFESLASHFEASYNHRFEEPGAATIASFPRILPSAVRRQDTTRKEARERRKERKEEELRRRQEEVKRMKALKMREIRKKLERVGREAGLKKFNRSNNDDDDEFMDEALKELDLDGEWDPEKHDRQMAGLFDDRDAQAGEDDDAWAGKFDDGELDSDGKPKWDDDIDIGDIAPPDDDAVVFHGDLRKSKGEKKKKKKKKKGDEDEDGVVDVDAMDAEIQQNDEEWDGTEEMRKRKLNEYMDQVYGLDFNDIVGGVSTRFRYVPVQPQDYALTSVEILLATDQELNNYVSVKKYAPYRQDKGDRYRWNKKDQEKLHELKSTIKNRTGNAFGMRSTAGGQASGDSGEKAKKRKGKKERMKAKATLEQPEEISEVPVNDQTISVVEQETTSFKKRKRGDKDIDRPGEPEQRKKKKRKHQENDAAAQA